jgi:hypothetical protein
MKWHIDPGHGWLEVKRAELESLGIAHKISPYSYEKNDRVYLEEDCDASLFFELLFNHKEWYKVESYKKLTNEIPEQVYKEQCKIREYNCYRSV